MKRIGIVLISLIIMVGCKNETKTVNTPIENKIESVDTTNFSLTICDCLDSLEANEQWCATHYTETITIQQKFECSGDSSLLDTISEVVKDSIRTDYENDLSLEIKEIEEEKADPISEECKQFLEEYAEAIKDFKYLTDQVEKNPDDIGLKISYSSQSEDMNSWGSKPQMFQCSQSQSFKTQVEILNVKKDKLIEN